MQGFYDQARETLDRDALERLQEEKLRFLARALATNPFYKEKLGSPERIASLKELESAPFTTKDELVEAQRLHPPYGNLLTYPLARYRYLHQTSGTSGRPLVWLDTEEDWETWMRAWGHVYRGSGVTEEDVVFCAFSFGPYLAHWTAMEGARRLGALAVSGGGMSSLQRLRAILDHRVTVVVATPTYALHLAEVARQNEIDLRSSPVRITIHAGEPGASVPNVRSRIESAWGATCFDHAGATEVGAWAFPCQARSEGIHLNEPEFIFETIDPTSGARVADGVRGELVITTLGRLGMPVVRYRTGDLVERVTAPCPCGRTLARIRGGVLGRADDMFTIRGVNLYPSAIDNVIRELTDIVEYEVEVRRAADLDELRIKVEIAEGAPFPEVERALAHAFRTHWNLRVRIVEAAPRTLPRYELKARRYKRVVD